MKKIILIVIFCFITVGCSNNNELTCHSKQVINKETVNITTTYYYDKKELIKGESKLVFSSENAAQAYYQIYKTLGDETMPSIDNKEVSITINIFDEEETKEKAKIKKVMEEQGFKCY